MTHLRNLVIPLLAGLVWSTNGQSQEKKKPFNKSALVLEIMAKPKGFKIFYTTGQAEVATAKNQLAEATRLYGKVIGMLRDYYPADHIAMAGPINNLGMIYQQRTQYTQAEEHYRKALAIRAKHVGANHEDYAQTLTNMGTMFFELGDQFRAEEHLKRARDIYVRKKTIEHRGLAPILNNLALVQLKLGAVQEAGRLLEQCRRLVEKHYGKNSAEMTKVLNNLATYHWHLNQPKEAERFFLRSLDLVSKYYRHPLTIHPQHVNLGYFYLDQKRFKLAHQHLQASLKVGEKWQKELPHLEVVSRTNLAEYHLEAGDHQALQTELEITQRRLQKHFPNQSSLLTYNRFQLGQLMAGKERWSEALQFFDDAFRRSHRNIRTVLPGLSEAEQQYYLRRFKPLMHTSLSIAVARPGDPEVIRVSAEWVLNGKSLIQESLSERYLLQRWEKNGPGAAQLVKKLKTVRQQIAMLTHSPLSPGQSKEDVAKRIAKLFAEERNMATELARSTNRTGTSLPWVSLEAVRKAVPPDAVLVDFFRCNALDLADSKIRKLEPQYFAWIIPPAGKGSVTFINIGSAQQIEEHIKAVRVAISRNLKNYQQNEREYKQAVEPLRKNMLDRLLPHLKGARHWILSPDADLWLVPWEALPLDKGYLVEKHQVQFVVSGRAVVDFKAKQHAKEKRSMSLVLADPAYDRQTTTPSGKDNDSQAQRLRKIGLSKVARLPGTEKEAKAILPKLKKYAGHQPILWTGPDASESKLRSANQPQVLVLATHGFFLDTPQPTSNRLRGIGIAPGFDWSPSGSAKNGAATVPHPLLRCGLVLAGFNQRQAKQSADDDGLLTGLEILGLNLSGTELVVLSACETSLGVSHPGEGLASLRQAFHLAGGESVLATSWQIPDAETSVLMSDYFDNLSQDWNKSDALCRAQRQMIQRLRNRHNAAPPFFWAAFSLTGDPGGPGKNVERPSALSTPANANDSANQPAGDSANTTESWQIWQLLLIGAAVVLCSAGLAYYWRRKR